MMAVLNREGIYLWYYFSIQLEQILPFWVLGMLIGSAVSVFFKDGIHRCLARLSGVDLGLGGVVLASALGIASPLCMYGTIPIAASFAKSGVREDWLAAFMMSSVLLNPQLIIYSAALGTWPLLIRVASCFLCGIGAGLLVHLFYRQRNYFTFTVFSEPENHDTEPKLWLRYLYNLGRNFKATGWYFFLGLVLAALFQRHVAAGMVQGLFGGRSVLGVFLAATIGVPLYTCGGGTIPLLQQWLYDGMSLGSAAAFMVTGPATKITNLGALKIVLGMRGFCLYLAYVMVFSFLTGLAVNLL